MEQGVVRGKEGGKNLGRGEERQSSDVFVSEVLIESSADTKNATPQILIGSPYVFFKSWFCVELQSIAARALMARAVPCALVVLCEQFFP